MNRRAWPVLAVPAAVLGLVVAGWTGPRPALAQGRAWTTQLTLSDLRSISCASTSSCWAAGSNSTAPVIYHTADGGSTWTIQTVANPIGFLQSVYCQSNGLDCWAAGTAEAGTGANGVIYSTTNGGTTWSGALVLTQNLTQAHISRLNGITCPGSGAAVTCIAVGNAGSGPTTGLVVLVAGDLAASTVRVVATPGNVAALTGVACQGTSDCLATGLTSSDQTTGVFSGTLIGTTSGGQSWSATQIPADISSLADVGCTASGDCAAVGYDAPSGGAPQAVVIDGPPTATSWTAEAHISGVDYLDGIACPAPHTCLAAGYSGSSAELAWTTDGTSWSTQAAGSGYLDGVACPASGTCWAAGYQGIEANGSGHIEALTLVSGSWTLQDQVALGARIALAGVSCADQSDCVAVGNSASGPVILISADGVTWTSEPPPSAPPGVVYHLDSVACPSKQDCVAVGYETLTAGGSLTKMAISTSSTTGGTTWSTVTAPSGVTHFDAVTCTSTARCLAAGTDITNLATSGLTGVIDTTTNLGSAWSPTTVPATVGYLTGVSCARASSTCAAVGGTPSGAPTVLSTTTGMTWQSQALPSLPNGGIYSDIYAVACPATTSCSAVGDQLVLVNGTAQAQAVILSGTGAGLATWSVQTSPAGTGPLRSVSCSTTTTCEAVGTTLSPDTGNGPSDPTTTAVSTNDGSTWAADTLPTDVPVLRAVACVAGTSTCRATGTSAIAGVG